MLVIIFNILSTVHENIIGAPKMRNYYGAIQSLIFLLLVVELSLLLFFVLSLSHLNIVIGPPTIVIAIVKDGSNKFFFTFRYCIMNGKRKTSIAIVIVGGSIIIRRAI